MYDQTSLQVNSMSEHRLTRRQMEVLALISEGHSNKEIADCLTLSEATVKVYCREIYKLLHVNNRTKAAIIAQAILNKN